MIFGSKRLIYTMLELGDDSEENRLRLQRLREAQLLIGYLELTPQPPREEPFLPIEHTSLYVFHPERFSRYLVWPDDFNSPRLKILPKTAYPQIESLMDMKDNATGVQPFGPSRGIGFIHHWRASGSNISEESFCTSA